MAKDKTVNYTDEQVSQMLDMYQEVGNEGLAQIAETLGKNVRSVRSKLVREGVYVASPRKAARKVQGPTKKELLNDLETIVGFDVTGFSGATKPAIQTLIERLSA